MNNEDQKRDEFELILPRGMRAEVEARAAKRGYTPEALIDEVCRRIMTKPKAQLGALMMRAEAIADALIQGVPAPWPDNFDECLEVGVVHGGLFTCGSEDYLLELEGEEMDVLEAICKKRGISYEEATREAIDLLLERGSG